MVEGKVMSPPTGEQFCSWSCIYLSSHTLKAQQTSHHRKKPSFMVSSMVLFLYNPDPFSSSYVVNDALVSGVHCKLYAYGLFSEVITKLRSFRNLSQRSVTKWRHNYIMPGRISIARHHRIDSLKIYPGFITKRNYPEWSIHQKNVHYSHGWGYYPTPH